jgi:diacylglycerol kinase family enzyme
LGEKQRYEQMQIGVITNPNSRKNQNRPNRAAELQGIIGDLGEVRATQRPEDVKPVLREFLRKKARFWVSDGGDGALHWMLRFGMEVLEEEEFAQSGACLPLALPTNGGSIDFVAHNVGIRGNAESILSRLKSELESGGRIEEVEVDSMLINGTQVTGGELTSFRTLGFAVAAGGIGQRFFGKLEEAGRHTSRNIVSIIAKTVASYPVAMTPLRHLPGMPKVLRQFARDMFRPTEARISVDGEMLPFTSCTGIHIASMSINLGGVLRFFSKADTPGQLHATLGAPSPLQIILNIPIMHMGWQIKGPNVLDGPCREMTMEAAGDELLAPVIDGEYYENVKSITFKPGPRVRIPKVVGRPRPNPLELVRKPRYLN